jgi:F-type H+-transporting ATPase subunit gamma
MQRGPRREVAPVAKARAIVKRAKAVRNIRKITRTMQLIATARFQKAFNRAVATRPFTDKITELVRQLSESTRGIDHPLLRRNSGTGRSVLLVLTSNRGLCGGYNSSLERTGMAVLTDRQGPEHQVRLQVSGKKGISYFKFQGRPPDEAYTHFEDAVQYADVEPLAEAFIQAYSAGEIDGVRVVYMRFESTSKHYPEVLELLPTEAVEPEAEAGDASRAPQAEIAYDFSPEPAQLLAELLPMTVKTRLFQCFTDAAVSEQVARMVAMKSATDAASDMIKQLTQAYNRARQSQITLELLDIVGGAEALQ